MTGLSFHKACEIAVDVDVPLHVVVHLIFFSDPDFPDEPDKGGTVKLLRLGVVLNKSGVATRDSFLGFPHPFIRFVWIPAMPIFLLPSAFSLSLNRM